MLAHSWLPRNKKKFSGYLILYDSRRHIVSRDYFPIYKCNHFNWNYLYPHSLLEISNYFQEDSLHTQIASVDRSTSHVHHLFIYIYIFLYSYDGEPQILSGASSSSNMGWLISISLAFSATNLTSYSVRLTALPGLHPRTLSNFSMT